MAEKKVLITGGTRGIGLQTAIAFSKKGYAVTVSYSTNESDAKEARKLGLSVERVDVANEKEVQALFEKIGDVDILVNNAGIDLLKQIQDTTLDEWERLFAVNVRGAFLCTREAVRGMIAKKSGLIVNVSSVWGEVGASCESAYSATKAALIGFTKSLAKELGPSGIRVNAVSPGVIDTRMNACFSKEELCSLCEEIPLGRIGKSEEVAAAILSLEENAYLTGIDLPVGGGFGF